MMKNGNDVTELKNDEKWTTALKTKSHKITFRRWPLRKFTI